MPFVADKFKTYDLFAKASLEDVYGSMDDKYQKETNEFGHLLLLNRGSGQFEPRVLPHEAQITPFLKMVKHDLNQDGYEDIIAGGNIYSTEAETPRLDFNSVVLLISDKEKGFDVKFGSEFGISLSGEAKSLEIINAKNNDYLLIGINNQIPEIYKISNTKF